MASVVRSREASPHRSFARPYPEDSRNLSKTRRLVASLKVTFGEQGRHIKSLLRRNKGIVPHPRDSAKPDGGSTSSISSESPSYLSTVNITIRNVAINPPPKSITSDAEISDTGARESGYRYQHRALNPANNEIRLLKILPVRMVGEDEFGTVECSLIVASLDDDPDYQALSYRWGDKSGAGGQCDPVNIVLDGKPFKVNPNLEIALRHLRSYREVKLFWTDAICINQENNEEKSEQIGKMRMIYEKAKNVVAWLGGPTRSTRLGFSLFEELYQYRYSTSDMALDTFLNDSSNTEKLESMIDLFNRDYWNRVWMIQEVRSAARIILMCGKYEIEWLKVKEVQNLLASYLDMERLGEESKFYSLTRCLQEKGARSYAVTGYNRSSGLPELYTLLSAFWTKDATNPSDKVYALIGMSSARDDQNLPIDCSASTRRVYINATKYIVTSSKKLDVICCLPQGTNNLNLPSWVPDWSTDPKKAAIPLLTIMDPNERQPYNASSSSLPEFVLKQSDRILIARGLNLTCIKNVGQEDVQGFLGSSPDYKAAVPALINWYRMWKNARGSDCRRGNDFGKTIFWNSNSLPTREEVLAAIATLSGAYCAEVKIEPEMVEAKNRSGSNILQAKERLHPALQLMRNRRIFHSTAGSVGICPALARPGDVVCILFGCSVPVLLRPKKNYYRLLGEVYVNEYMYGEGMDLVGQNPGLIEDFEIH